MTLGCRFLMLREFNADSRMILIDGFGSFRDVSSESPHLCCQHIYISLSPERDEPRFYGVIILAILPREVSPYAARTAGRLSL